MNKKELKKIIAKENPVILDIGCYDGKDARELSDVFNCEVHCFEPDPLSQDLFKVLHGNNKKLILHPYALSDFDGVAEFHQSNHPQSNSLKEPKLHLNLFPGVDFDEVTTVQCHRLDTWHCGGVIDLIWADVNGSEKELILGGLQTLEQTRYLYIEVSAKELYKGQKHFSFIADLIPDFRMILMDNWGDNFGNILFKNIRYE